VIIATGHQHAHHRLVLQQGPYPRPPDVIIVLLLDLLQLLRMLRLIKPEFLQLLLELCILTLQLK
jgi:hypothetical protein